MASELAMKLTEAGLAAKDGLIQDALDTELTEVRHVLRYLQRARDCWCIAAWQGTHDALCQRARALYERLEVK